MLILTTFIPALCKLLNLASVLEVGPMVQIIFVLVKGILLEIIEVIYFYARQKKTEASSVS